MARATTFTRTMSLARLLLLCALAAATLGTSRAALGHQFRLLHSDAAALSGSWGSRSPASQEHNVQGSSCGTKGGVKLHKGSIWQGKVLISFVLPSPTRALEVNMCCQDAGASRNSKFSIVDLGPSKSRPGQTDYMCTVYSEDATLATGNSSTMAAQAKSLPPPPPPPTPPKCAFSSAKSCITSGKCFWYRGNCSATPPASLKCADIRAMSSQVGLSLCMTMTLFDSDPFNSTSTDNRIASTSTNGVLGNFNWSQGVLNKYTRVTKMPPQIVKPDGEVHYWSISTGLVKNSSSPGGVSSTPLYAGVQYEEIISGQQSNSTVFDYILTGDALSSLDMQGPGHVGKVTGKTIMTETPVAFAYQMIFWPNVTSVE